MAERTPSRAALVELRREHDVIADGHRFLDEKRMLIAQRILVELDEYRAALSDFDSLQVRAARMLSHALEWHGLEELQVYPARALTDMRLQRTATPFVGLVLTDEVDVRMEIDDSASREWPSLPSPEATRCAELYTRLLDGAAQVSAQLGNLLRLLSEYRRTERRVRALENVVLPEVRSEERQIDEALEELEMEDILRVHLFKG